jgi:hypothetical protein
MQRQRRGAHGDTPSKGPAGMRGGVDARKARTLRQLERLARLRADVELARIGATARSRAALHRALAELGAAIKPLGPEGISAPGEPADPGRGTDGQDTVLPSPRRSAGTGPAPAGGGTEGADRGQDTGPDTGSAQRPGALAAGMAGPPVPGLQQPGVPVAPGLIRARLAHAVWIQRQRAELLGRLARIEADWRRQQPAAASAVGRLEALGRLADDAERRALRRQAESPAA